MGTKGSAEVMNMQPITIGLPGLGPERESTRKNVTIDDGRNLEECESRLHSAQQLLLDARPGPSTAARANCNRLLRCLNGSSRGSLAVLIPAVHRHCSGSGARRARSTSRSNIASNLCFGWIQTRLGAGYTAQGLPVLIANEPGSSFEG